MQIDTVADPARYTTQTPYSDPGRHAAVLGELTPTAAAVSAAARNVIVHYRGGGVDLTPEHRAQIDARWLDTILEFDQARHDAPLTQPRPVEQRVAGCCRDHTLFAVGALRQHGIPARSRVGFAGYFADDYHHDHVVAEYWNGQRWVRFEPEIEPQHGPQLKPPFDVLDMPTGPGAPFTTGAETWRAYRAGEIDPSTYGVGAGLGLDGPWFIGGYVLMEAAHLHGDELLLWDTWGAMGPDLSAGAVSLIDRLAELIVRACDGDDDAAAELADWYSSDERIRPGARVRTESPTGHTVWTDLTTRQLQPASI